MQAKNSSLKRMSAQISLKEDDEGSLNAPRKPHNTTTGCSSTTLQTLGAILVEPLMDTTILYSLTKPLRGLGLHSGLWMDRLSSTRSPMPSINEKGLWSQASPEDLFQAGAEELVLPEAWSVQCSRSGSILLSNQEPRCGV